MNMIYNTNALLSLARLPYHFWNSLNPKEDTRNNPGTSIISFIVAKTLVLESTFLPQELSENLKKCLDFTNQKNKICDFLKLRVKSLATILSNYTGHDKYWSIAINASISLDKIRTKIDEILIKLTGDITENDFSINDDLINVKKDIDNLKMILNDAGILFDWED